MTTIPYSMKLPENLPGFVPSPIHGEVFLGNGRDDSMVEIVSTLLLDDSDKTISIGKPLLMKQEAFGEYSRYRFTIPITLLDQQRPPIGSYPVRITYKIGETTADHVLTLRVFPRARVPLAQYE